MAEYVTVPATLVAPCFSVKVDADTVDTVMDSLNDAAMLVFNGTFVALSAGLFELTVGAVWSVPTGFLSSPQPTIPAINRNVNE